MSATTPFAKPTDVNRRWHLIDAAEVPLGRVATEVAKVLMGKHHAQFTRHVDTGDGVVVINAAQVKLTGRKLEQKQAYRHSGYPGGIKSESYSSLLARRPEVVIEKAVRGMLPKTPLGRKMIGKLKVYGGSEHQQQAQQPTPRALTSVRVEG